MVKAIRCRVLNWSKMNFSKIKTKFNKKKMKLMHLNKTRKIRKTLTRRSRHRKKLIRSRNKNKIKKIKKLKSKKRKHQAAGGYDNRNNNSHIFWLTSSLRDFSFNEQ